MDFKELMNAVYPKKRKVVVSALVNADTYGRQFDDINVGKVELMDIPETKENVIVFSELSDDKKTAFLINACIIIRETEVQSINEYDGKIIVLLHNGAYSISLN